MKIPLLRPVVPPHVFCLLAGGVTYAKVKREPPAGFVEARSFAIPANSLSTGPSGTPRFSREALAEAVTAARRLSQGRLKRASVVFPDAWARILPIDFDSLPGSRQAAGEMVLWKLKKLLPGVTWELGVTFHPMPPAGAGVRLLVAAVPAELLSSIEKAFESLEVRVGFLEPASLALLEGLSGVLGAAAGGDYALAHRAGGSLSLLIARGATPLFFRQRPQDGSGDHGQEVRLSLSYYAEKLKGEGLKAVYVHDELPSGDLARLEAFPVPPVPLSGRLFGADEGFDGRLASRPELLAGFAAVYGRN